ncbi:hypothetical protein HNR23_000528 [Nocardiopsis mwathae]|uniref:Uncharacterized protein n=1 Tax=Nocardiopsis mwathae TaxID=1472723 RepID=A0A7W9YE25_9ACTN|nr:hypothetical protein [Nocardiopsis mwathae]MBB6170468.1 hypothetical protein [Nocardiopsis mwathae]
MTPSFHGAEVERRGSTLVIACHTLLPLFALAKPPSVNAMNLEFVWHAELGRALRTVCRFTVLKPEEPAVPVERADLSLLGAVEREQIRYWKPATVGEIVFDQWD